MKKAFEFLVVAYLIPACIFGAVRAVSAITFFAFGPGSGIPYFQRFTISLSTLIGNTLGSFLWPISLALKGQMTFLQWLFLPWGSI